MASAPGLGPPPVLSTFIDLDARAWSHLRADTPMTLTAAEVVALRGLNDPVSRDEVESIHVPLSRLLQLHVDARRELHTSRAAFLGDATARVPFVIGLAGSVAVGKSTIARLLAALLSRWPAPRTVEIVPTDGFLWPNAELERRGLMQRKGFPDSYDRRALLDVLGRIKAGDPQVEVPVYSHVTYDVVPGRRHRLVRPDVVIVEGLNVLQPPEVGDPEASVVSDHFDFSVYVDADEAVVRRWYVERFLTLRETSFREERSHFRQYADLDVDAARRVAGDIWDRINGVNLRRNILPTRGRADLVLRKGGDHRVTTVSLRKL